jgi:hypothetical protein
MLKRVNQTIKAKQNNIFDRSIYSSTNPAWRRFTLYFFYQSKIYVENFTLKPTRPQWKTKV